MKNSGTSSGMGQGKTRWSRYALLAIAFIGLQLGASASFAEQRKWHDNPIGRACAKLLAPLEDGLRDKTPWATTDETETSIAALWNNPDPQLSLDARLEELHRLLWEDRLAKTNALSRSLTRSVIQNVQTQKSLYSRTLGRLIARFGGPHYNPVFNRSQHLPLAPSLGKSSDIVDLTVSIHELEHAYHRNADPLLTFLSFKAIPFEYQFIALPTPVTPLIRFRMESRALGAQWELVSRIPKPVRDHLIEDLKTRLSAIDVMSRADATSKMGKQEYEAHQAKILNDLKVTHGERGVQIYANMRSLVAPLSQWLATHKQKANILKALIQIGLASLENAELEKPEFLVKQAAVHNYTLSQLVEGHYKLGFIRKYLLSVGTISTLLWYFGGASGTLQTHIHDLDFLLQLLGMIAG